MQVGDLVVSTDRYTGQVFIILEIGGSLQDLIKCISLSNGTKTKWCADKTWEKI